MGFEMVKENYTGKIKEVKLGKKDKAVPVGGENCLSFHQFEGEMPNKPRIAMEVWDMEPPEWPEASRAPFADCLDDPAKWAKKCVEEYGAEMITLQMRSIDPNDKNASADDAVATVKKILEVIDVPLIVWGCANVEKDAEVLKQVAEKCEGENLIIGPIEDANHKAIGAATMGFGHAAIASSPIDVNLAKQINILLENLGMPLDRVIIDPTTGGLGYGMEYSYSVMERIKLAALTFGDDKLQLPLINNLSYEVWKSKEAKQPLEEDKTLGDPERRAVLMEAVAAVTYLMGGSDILIMRHPEAIRLVKSFIQLIYEGGDAQDVAPVKKNLEDVDIDYASLAPKPDLSIEEEKKAPAKEKKKAEAPKAEAKPEPAKEEKKAEAPKAEPAKEKKKAEAKPEPAKEEKKVEAKAEPSPEAEAEEKAKAEAEEKAKKEAEEKAKAEAEEKAKKEAEEKAKAEAEEKAKKEAEEKTRKEAEERAKREAEEQKMREKRMKEREERAAKRAKSAKKEEQAVTASKEQWSELEWLVEKLDLIHRRKKVQ